jgi:MoxR-like ATPase
MSTENSAVWADVQKQVATLKKEMATVIVGQEEIVELMLVALLCRGHCLIVGVPGLAKTLLVSTLGRILGLSFHRIQFTPDLMPMDILGSEILQDGASGKRAFEFAPGPIFANLILADEINRTPPKTQAALLEAMQERQVTISGKSVALPDPFIVYATQNPIEHEGTYPLPEAQLDRFFFNLKIEYPSIAEEVDIVNRTTTRTDHQPSALLDADRIRQLQGAIYDVPVPEHVVAYIVDLVHRTRPTDPLADDYIRNYVEWGAGPRASQYLTLAAKALAILRGNPTASEEEVRIAVRPVLRHRIIPNYNATGDGVDVEAILDHLLK